MNKKNIGAQAFLIIAFVIISSIIIFKLPDNNANNKQVVIALVNEDQGTRINDKYTSFGEQFINNFQVENEYEHEVTSQTKAFNGLEDKTYDVVLLLPKDYSEKLITYKNKTPQQTLIEYYTNSNVKQVEFLKGKLIANDIEKMINNTMVTSYSKELLHTFQSMQKKSQNVLKKQSEYNSNFETNIKEPMSKTYDNIDTIMSDTKSQQESVTTFGNKVAEFESNISSRKTEEESQRQKILELHEQNKETTDKLTSNNESIKSLNVDLQGSQKSGNYRRIIDIVKAGQTMNKALLGHLETAIGISNSLMNNLSEINKENKWLAHIYSEFRKVAYIDSETSSVKINLNDVGYPDDIAESEKTNFDTLKKQRLDSFISLANTINSNITQTSSLMKAANVEASQEIKDTIESEITNSCLEIDMSLLDSKDSLKTYCSSIDAVTYSGKKNEVTSKYEYVFEKTYLDLNDNKVLTIDFSKLKDGVVDSILVNGEEAKLTTRNKYEYEINNEKKISIKLILIANGSSELFLKSKDNILISIDDKQEKYDINNYYITEINEDKNSKAIQATTALIEMYYGRSVEKVLNGPANKVLETDENEELVGIKQYRVSYGSNSLISIASDPISTTKLKLTGVRELARAHENIYIEKSGEIVTLINNTIEERDKLLKDIAITTEGYNEDADTKDIENFENEYKDIIKRVNDISNVHTEAMTSHDGTTKIGVTLDANQIKLLSGFTELEKKITEQQKQVDDIQKAADEFKKNVDKMEKETKAYQKNVDSTQKEFVSLTKTNKDYVTNFVKQYKNSKIKGQDNEDFYNNLSNPIAIYDDEASYNVGSLIPFYLIVLLSIFSIVNAYFTSHLRFKSKEGSDFVQESRYLDVNKRMVILSFIAIVSGLITSYVGLQVLDFNIVSLMAWMSILLIISITLSYLFFALLYRFKTVGIVLIGILLITYFITNGALGLTTTSLPVFSILKNINPLILFEAPIQNIVAGQAFSILAIASATVVTLIIAILIAYLPQRKRSDKYETI